MISINYQSGFNTEKSNNGGQQFEVMNERGLFLYIIRNA